MSQPLWGSAGEVRAAGEGGADTPPQRLLPRGSQAAHSILPRPGNSVQTSFENTPQTLHSAGTAGESHCSEGGGLVTPSAGKRSSQAVLGHPDLPRLGGQPRLTVTSRDHTRGWVVVTGGRTRGGGPTVLDAWRRQGQHHMHRARARTRAGSRPSLLPVSPVTPPPRWPSVLTAALMP